MSDSSLPWIPRFVFGSDSLQLTYPLMRWTPGARTEGRVLTSGSGIIGPYLRTRKYVLGLVLRFTEEEWGPLADFLAFAQTGEPFTWYPNGNDGHAPSAVDVWLESPRVAQVISPQRSADVLWMFSLPIAVSRTSSPWDLEYFYLPA